MRLDPERLALLFEAGEIDRTLWTEHFPDIPERTIPTCNDCIDCKAGECKQKANPVECFLYGTHSRANSMLMNRDRVE